MDLRKLQGYILIFTLTITVLITSIQVNANIYSEPEPHALRTVPDTHPIEFLSARDLLLVGDTPGAVERLRRSFERYPYHGPTVREYLQWVLHRQGPESLSSLVRGHFERTGSSDIFRSFFSEVEADTSSYRNVLRWLDRKKADPHLRRIRVQLLVDNHQYARAKTLIRDGLERFPEDRRLAFLYAEVLARRSSCKRAYRRIRAIVERNPGWARPYLLQYRLLSAENKEKIQEVEARYRSLTGKESLSEREFKSIDCAVKSQKISGQSS